MPSQKWEIVIAVDGSQDGTVEVLEKWTDRKLLPIKWFYQDNAGQCVARHNAIMMCHCDKIIIIDDDLNPSPAFLQAHLNALVDGGPKAIIIGKVLPCGDWKKRPLYELVREYSTTILHRAFEAGGLKPVGEHLVTQNVSFYKSFYLEVGGFDAEMRLGEDTLLGVQFERSGGKFLFCPEAAAVHESNIGSYDAWIRRQYDYGRYAWLAWKKSKEDILLHPLKNLCTGSRLNRLIVLLFGRSDFFTGLLLLILRQLGIFLKYINFLLPAVATHKAIVSIRQHQGLRDTYGSWSSFRKAEEDYRCRVRLSYNRSTSSMPNVLKARLSCIISRLRVLL